MQTGFIGFAIPFKRSGFLIGVLVTLSLVILMTLLVFFPQVLGRTAEPLTGKTLLFFVVFQVSLLTVCIINIAMLAKKTPAVILDSYGIIHNTSVWGTVEAAWPVIIRPALKISGKKKYLLLLVDDPQQIINQAASLPLRWTLQLNQRLHKTPVVIDLDYLKEGTEQLQDRIETELERRKSLPTA